VEIGNPNTAFAEWRIKEILSHRFEFQDSTEDTSCVGQRMHVESRTSMTRGNYRVMHVRASNSDNISTERIHRDIGDE
jgi:hypothetical protein